MRERLVGWVRGCRWHRDNHGDEDQAAGRVRLARRFGAGPAAAACPFSDKVALTAPDDDRGDGAADVEGARAKPTSGSLTLSAAR